jgi:hypothetical protein
MTSSATQDFLSDVLSADRIPAGKLAYFQTRLAGNIHQAMLKLFGRLEHLGTFTRRELARRIGRKPEQITRWFSYPGNLTLATVSDIFLGMGYELESITLTDLATGRRIQCPDKQVDLARLMGLYREQESRVAPPESFPQRPLGNYVRNYDTITEFLSSHQPARATTLRELLSVSSGPGKAASAQLQTQGTSLGNQVGQAA